MSEKDSTKNKTKRVTIRFSEQEYQLLTQRWKKSTTRKFADYLRKCLFDKPVVTTYRNKSQDDFMAEMMLLRKDLNGLANNFNQGIKRLHTFFHQDQAKTWTASWETARLVLLTKVDQIKKSIGKIADQWLQS